jgi:hypothetical protein
VKIELVKTIENYTEPPLCGGGLNFNPTNQPIRWNDPLEISDS